MADEVKPSSLQEQQNLLFPNFDVNAGIDSAATETGRLPSIGGAMTVEDYANYWTVVNKGGQGVFELLKTATQLPPSVQGYTNITYMPNAQTSQFGILQWPGLPPQILEKVAKENLGPQLIITNRQDEVLRYCDISNHPWRPGWHIIPEDATEVPDASTRSEIRDAEQFLLNAGVGEQYSDPRKRDSLYRYSFSRFLGAITRNTLTFDGIAIWTQMDSQRRITSFAPLPAQNIRLLDRPDRPRGVIDQAQLDFMGGGDAYREGYSNGAGKQHTNAAMSTSARARIYRDPTLFAVAVDESGNVVDKFNRDQLIWYIRNPRLDTSVYGYGYPEFEMCLTLINGLTNAIQFNADIFNRNSVPKGILAIKGQFTQRQLDAMGRIWDNLQRGARNDWTLPAIQLSEKGGIEVISLEPLRKESAYYANLLNLFMGALAAIYRFPAHKLGYKVSGTERDSRRDLDKKMENEDDEGLPVLLGHLEQLINQYLLKTRWPHLRFQFTGKSPKEDSRLYENKMLAMTLNEKRAIVGLVPMEETVTSEGAKEVAELMGMAPVDPALAGIYQSLIAAKAKMLGNPILEVTDPEDVGMGMGGEEGKPGGRGGRANAEGVRDSGARFTSKKDPAKSEAQGHAAGLRRDSKAESGGGGVPNLRQRTQVEGT